MIDTEISIDRITLIAYDVGTIEEYLKHSGYIIRQNFSQNYGFRHSYHCQKGELIEMGDRGRVRLDFNPNKANMEQIEDILSRLKYPHLTRLDIAVDYFGIDLSKVEWISKKRRKRNIWKDENGILETLYIGAPSSEKRFRIYNKALERLEKGEERDPRAVNGHWRVEVQKRYKESDNILDPKEYFLPDLFDIRPYSSNLDLSFIKDVKERIMITGILADNSLLNELHRNTRPKYKKLIQEARERAGKVLEIEPHEIYEKEKSLLADQLTDLLSKCYRPLALYSQN